MAGHRPPRDADAFWMDGVPPLHGLLPERRPVIVIDEPDFPAPAGMIMVVPTTTREPAGDVAILIEGILPRTCWAVPRWVLYISHARFERRNYICTLPAFLRDRLVNAVLDCLVDDDESAPDDPNPPT